jgi:hypothetical protein
MLDTACVPSVCTSSGGSVAVSRCNREKQTIRFSKALHAIKQPASPFASALEAAEWRGDQKQQYYSFSLVLGHSREMKTHEEQLNAKPW